MKCQWVLAVSSALAMGGASAAWPATVSEGDQASRLLRHAAGSFGLPTTFTVGRSDERWLAIGDWDGDGFADLAVAERSSDEVWLLRGDGTGGFAFSGAARSRQTVAARADFDGDGWVDQAVADPFATRVGLRLGDGTGRPFTVLLADFDRDGRADLATLDRATSDLIVLLGDERGEVRSTRRMPVGSAPATLATTDFNGDGFADLVVADRRSDNVSILLGDGLGGFGPATPFDAGVRPAMVAVGDVNGDGMADVAAGNRSDAVSILLGNGRGELSLASRIDLGRSPRLAADARADNPEDYEGVAALTLSPTTILGGSGGSATGTVTLNAPAPAGGVVVTLASSNVELAATMPRVVVPAGATSATFAVATNARYRPYSALAFSVTISATHAATRSATLNVTAQPRPADFNSGSQANANTQWNGLMCGGIAPIGGNKEILYDCSPATGTGFGSCTFRQECSLGCRRVPPNGRVFNDFCATSGPNAIAVSRNYFVSGDHVPATVVTGTPVAIPTTGVPSAISIGANARSFSPTDVGGLHFPTGATSMPFDVATSYVPAIEFVDVTGFWFDDDIPPFLITNGRGGHVWVAMLPPEPPPAQPVPTPVQFKIVGSDPVTGGQHSLGQLHLSGIPYGIGPTITFTSSHPQIVPAPAAVTPAASNILGFDVDIATRPPTADTDVTITATDGRYAFGAVLRVLVPPPAPVLSGVSVSPGSVVGGSPATGTVHLSAPQAGPTVVQVSIIDTAPATLPSNNPPCPPSSRCHNVTVPAGATSASFTIATAAVTGTFNLNVFASLAGSPGQSALLLIGPGGPLALSTLTVTPDSGVGGTSLTGRVTLNGPAPAGGARVTLSRDNPAAAVPASVLVPSGQSSAGFTVTTSAVTATTNVRISAAFNGSTANADLTLFALLAQVSFPGNVPGGNLATGTVTLAAPAPSGGAVVTLTSANTARVTVPASVTVPAGQASATFMAQTSTVTATTPVVVSASLGGTTVSTTLFLVVSRAVASVTLNPSSVSGGNASTATVTLRAASTGNAIVSLASSNALLAVVPATVSVPTGRTSATFTVSTAPVTATATVVISAAYEDVTRSATLTINPSATPPPPPPPTPAPLPAPTLASPARDARFSRGQSIIFDWSNVSGAASYTLQIDDANNFSAPQIVSQTVAVSSYVTSTLPARRMWWRVRANDAAGNPGPWSSVRRFEVRN